MEHRHIAGLLVVLLAVSFVGAAVYGKLGKSRPIYIEFTQRPAREIKPEEIYALQVTWQNKDKRLTYEGSFVFIVRGAKFRVTASDLTFTFEGSVVSSQGSGDSLVYRLPQQSFSAGHSGTITVEITYFNPGKYSWEIGIAESLQLSLRRS